MPSPRKIALLPSDIQNWLRQAFIDRAFGDIVGLTEELNAIMKKANVAITIGKSAVGAEAQRVKRAQESIAAVTRNMQLIADSAGDDSDKRGEALNAMVATEMFEVLLSVREAEVEVDPVARMKLMNQAALGAARLTTSSVRQRKFRTEVEDRAKKAADKISEICKSGGMDAATEAQIRRRVLGIVKRESPTSGSSA